MRDAGKAIFYLSYPINSIGSAGRAHNAPPDPLVVWVGRPSPHPSPLAPSGLASWKLPSAPI